MKAPTAELWDITIKINYTKAKCELVHAVAKTAFGFGNVTIVARTSVKMLFIAFDYNLYQLRTLGKKGAIQ